MKIAWRKPGKCDTGSCIEVARTSPNRVVFRDPVAHEVHYTVDEMRAFIDAVKRGEYDDLVS